MKIRRAQEVLRTPQLRQQVESLHKTVATGFKRYRKARTLSGRRQASALIQDSMLNLEVLLGCDSGAHLYLMIRQGKLNVDDVLRWALFESRR